MSAFWDGFAKQAAKKEKSDLTSAAQIGGGTALGMAGVSGSRSAIRDARAYKKAPKARSVDELRKHVRPGDIVFTRKDKSPSWNNRGRLKEKHVIQSAMGSPEYHAGLVTDKNKQVFHAFQGDASAAHHYLRKGQAVLPGESVHVYRPTKASKKEVREALKQPSRLRNRKYKYSKGMVGDALKGLISPKLTPKACHKIKGRVVCNEIVTSAYPKQFKRRGATIEDMKKTKGMKLVATYGKKPKLLEQLTSRAVYPIARNLKWAPIAGGLAYAGLKAKKKFDQKKKELPRRATP